VAIVLHAMLRIILGNAWSPFYSLVFPLAFVCCSNKFVQGLGSDNGERNLLVLQFGFLMHGYDSRTRCVHS
jgi:hypothetical protein